MSKCNIISTQPKRHIWIMQLLCNLVVSLKVELFIPKVSISQCFAHSKVSKDAGVLNKIGVTVALVVLTMEAIHSFVLYVPMLNKQRSKLNEEYLCIYVLCFKGL